MLQLQQLHKAYTTANFTQIALNNVSISFRDNEFVAILGPSGSGKTTLLNIVGGLDHYDSGDLVIDGVSTREYKDADWDAYRNNRIGFVFQSYNLIPHQSVLSNVELALTLSGVGKEERQARARQALIEVGLEDHIDKRPSQLSGGQMQRVAIARALINDPDILLADEPTGALDSTTSVQIMDLLTEIARDRLVIMVTHNPDLAEEYANRIVELHDGVIVSDTNPYDPTEEEAAAENAHPMRRTAMSFKTALSLSFNNLMTKKGRTIMTAFAGSIGIIGIAAILALASGVDNYIARVEEETLSEYPLQITSSGFSLSGSSDDESSDTPTAEKAATSTTSNAEGEVRVNRIMTGLFSSVGANDLKSLKAYLESGTSGIEEYVNTIEYQYNVQPQIFLKSDYGTRQVNPDSTFASMGMGSSSYGNSLMSTMYSTDVFYEMPTNGSLYENQYTMLAGSWPQSYDECVLVLGGRGNVTDFMLYTLGKRDPQELNSMIKQFIAEEKIDVPEITDTYTYNDFLGITYKVVNSADTYVYDGTYGVWKDKSGDSDYMSALIDNGINLKIVGVVKPNEGSKVHMLSTGINYTHDLTLALISHAENSSIVQQQLANPTVDVITGRSFEEEENSSTSDFDMSQMFTIDESVVASAFGIDQSKVSIDQTALMEAVSAAIKAGMEDGSLSFPMPTADEIALGLSDEGLTQLASTAGGLFLQYLSEPGVIQKIISGTPVDKMAIPGDFANWVATSEDPIASTGMTPRQMMNAVTMSAAFSSPALTTYLTRAASEYTASLTGVVVSATAANVASQMGSSIAQAVTVDSSAFARAFKFNLSGSDLTEIITSMYSKEDRTYANNLKNFGYANLDEPSEIDIYPKDFASKDHVKEILDNYNTEMKAAGQEDKVIGYTDLVGTLMSSVTTIVDMISAVLIAFVAISLVVSSIMIGVITYISVLERIKEIGILRAIGASKRDVARIFNAETVIEGFVSGVLGIVVTALLCIPANIIIDIMFDVENLAAVPVLGAILLIIISVLLSFIAGLIPSRSASKKDPVEALRSE